MTSFRIYFQILTLNTSGNGPISSRILNAPSPFSLLSIGR